MEMSLLHAFSRSPGESPAWASYRKFAGAVRAARQDTNKAEAAFATLMALQAVRGGLDLFGLGRARYEETYLWP